MPLDDDFRPDLAPLVATLDASAIANADVCLAVLAALALLVAPDQAALAQLLDGDASRVARIASGNAVQQRKARWHGRQGAKIEGAMNRAMAKAA